MYPELNLNAWPFQVVPDADFAKIWAGRRKTKEQVGGVVASMKFVPRSSLRLLWANFGMGKTHTLLHIRHLCQGSRGQLVPIYAVMPGKPTGFIDLYRAIVSELPYEFLGDQLIKVGTGYPSVALHPMFAKSPGVVNALLAVRRGELEESMAARQWLAAQPGLSSHDLRAVKVSYRIKTAEDAVNALTALTRLATFRSGSRAKLVVLIDEYQRIGELKTIVRNEINAGLHAYYNASPHEVDLFLSFSFGRQENMAYFLSNELKSRAELNTINLDVLTKPEALEFLTDLLKQFRLRPDERWAFPFTPEALEAIIDHVASAKSLTPRRLMLYANQVLAMSQFTDGREPSSEITAKEAREWLADPALGSLDVDEADH
jgi:hypothetical protein